MSMFTSDHTGKLNDRTLRMCEVCKNKKPREFGHYVPYNNGLNQKWHCLKCYEKRNRR